MKHKTFELKDGYTKKNPEVNTFREMTVDEAKLLMPGDRVPFICRDGTQRDITINGLPKMWKKTPGKVEVPLKFGLYEYSYAVEIYGDNGLTGYVSNLLVLVEKE